MKITDSLITALLRNGVMGLIKNFKTEISIPNEDGKPPITCLVTADNLEIKILKDRE